MYTISPDFVFFILSFRRRKLFAISVIELWFEIRKFYLERFVGMCLDVPFLEPFLCVLKENRIVIVLKLQLRYW